MQHFDMPSIMLHGLWMYRNNGYLSGKKINFVFTLYFTSLLFLPITECAKLHFRIFKFFNKSRFCATLRTWLRYGWIERDEIAVFPGTGIKYFAFLGNKLGELSITFFPRTWDIEDV